jgi:hypothetical protein
MRHLDLPPRLTKVIAVVMMGWVVSHAKSAKSFDENVDNRFRKA